MVGVGVGVLVFVCVQVGLAVSPNTWIPPKLGSPGPVTCTPVNVNAPLLTVTRKVCW